MPLLIDLTGQRFGSWTVLSKDKTTSGANWLCRCDCGTERVVNGYSLRNGTSISCRCSLKANPPRLIDLTGKRFGRWTVLHRIGHDFKWLCQCDCGTTREVASNSLRYGLSISCRCSYKDKPNRPVIDLSGKCFGVLTVLSREQNVASGTSWLCHCECGRQRIVAAGNLKNRSNRVCGCELGFDYSKPTDTYYVRVSNPYGSPLYKVGITQRTLPERFEVDYSKITPIELFQFETGFQAYEFEQDVITKHHKHRYTGPDLLKRGNTELFTKDILSLDA
jgi:hypothetical protein